MDIWNEVLKPLFEKLIDPDLIKTAIITISIVIFVIIILVIYCLGRKRKKK